MNEYRVTVEFTVRENNELDAVDLAYLLVYQALRITGRQSDIRVLTSEPVS